jgi:putative phosphoribosyl transferase
MARGTLFRDRQDAGRQLAALLTRYRDEAPFVLGLPRGGVPVAYEVARSLGAPLDVWIVRKIGAPYQPELGVGAIAEGGDVYLDRELISMLGITEEELTDLAEREAAEVERRVRRYRGRRPPPDVRGRTVLLIDDGIATGSTLRAVARAIRRLSPRRLIIAAPVAASATLESLAAEADDVIAVESDPYLGSVGAYYVDFTQTSDEEVRALLERARAGAAPEGSAPQRPGGEQPVQVRAGNVLLEGDLAVPAGAGGVVLFAHGSGSSRRSPRNRFVAESLRRNGLGTLLFDLLTTEEALEDEATSRLRFDIDLLGRRLIAATDWARRRPDLGRLRFGYFGASTGAAAALVAAAERPDDIAAVVSRGGRPDLAGPYLERVRAPTLLIVGSADPLVLDLNQDALDRMRAPRGIAVIPGATHLFEEPGALEEVARVAAQWFTRHLLARPAEARA